MDQQLQIKDSSVGTGIYCGIGMLACGAAAIACSLVELEFARLSGSALSNPSLSSLASAELQNLRVAHRFWLGSFAAGVVLASAWWTWGWARSTLGAGANAASTLLLFWLVGGILEPWAGYLEVRAGSLDTSALGLLVCCVGVLATVHCYRRSPESEVMFVLLLAIAAAYFGGALILAASGCFVASFSDSKAVSVALADNIFAVRLALIAYGPATGAHVGCILCLLTSCGAGAFATSVRLRYRKGVVAVAIGALVLYTVFVVWRSYLYAQSHSSASPIVEFWLSSNADRYVYSPLRFSNVFPACLHIHLWLAARRRFASGAALGTPIDVGLGGRKQPLVKRDDECSAPPGCKNGM